MFEGFEVLNFEAKSERLFEELEIGDIYSVFVMI